MMSHGKRVAGWIRSHLPHHIHAVAVADLWPAALRMPVAVGAIVHLEQMQLAGLCQLFAVERIRFAEHLGALQQGAHKDVGHVHALQQIGLNLLGYLPEGLQVIIVVLQAIRIVVVQLAIIILGQVHRLMVGNGKQILKELVQCTLQAALAIQNAIALAIIAAVVRRVLQMAKSGRGTEMEGRKVE